LYCNSWWTSQGWKYLVGCHCRCCFKGISKISTCCKIFVILEYMKVQILSGQVEYICFLSYNHILVMFASRLLIYKSYLSFIKLFCWDNSYFLIITTFNNANTRWRVAWLNSRSIMFIVEGKSWNINVQEPKSSIKCLTLKCLK